MLAPGAYRNINQDATPILTGGVYEMEKLDIRQDAKLHFTAAAEMRVKNEMDTDAEAFIGPAPSVPSLTASNISSTARARTTATIWRRLWFRSASATR
jgi:hypothetical protein